VDWIQVFTIVGSLSVFMFWIFSKLDADIRGSNQRVDQLYQMFVDLLKEKK